MLAYFSCIGPRICIRFLILFCPRVFWFLFRYLIPFSQSACTVINSNSISVLVVNCFKYCSNVVEAVTEVQRSLLFFGSRYTGVIWQ